VRIESGGSVSPEEVWERYTDPALWPTWAPQVRAVTGTVEPVLPGDRGWVLGPVGTRVPFVVLAVDAGSRRWSWRVGVRPAAVVMEHGVDADGHGSRAWVDIRAPRLLVLPYLPVAWLALRRLVG
jgi:uncharacterized protein YndB with AHSA1/START domain